MRFLLFNEGRYLAFERVFGVRRDQVNVMTLIATLVLAGAVEKKAERLLAVLRPTRSDAIFGTGALNELGGRMLGMPTTAPPVFGLVVATAVVGGVFARGVRRSAHDVRVAAHDLRLVFKELYGPLRLPARAAEAIAPD